MISDGGGLWVICCLYKTLTNLCFVIAFLVVFMQSMCVVLVPGDMLRLDYICF